MPPKRKTIAQRNAAAIAKEVTEQAAQAQAVPATPTPVPAPKPEPSTQQVAKADELASAEKVKRQARNALDERKNLGIYLTTETYDAMKAAYLADWTNRRGDADTLYKWVEDALDAHAARSVTARSQSAVPRERGETRTGNTRAFKVAEDVYQRMQHAIAADEQAGRWLSESPWSVEAITAAIDAARTANGGTFPAPPTRLPNRLKRRD